MSIKKSSINIEKNIFGKGLDRAYMKVVEESDTDDE